MGLMRDALACRNRGLPSGELETFIRENHSGYVLTHQLLAIAWTRSVGCVEPQEWGVRQTELADRVLSELEKDSRFSDLLAEQVAVIVLAGRTEALRREWIEKILEAQEADGCWEPPPEQVSIRFRGYTMSAEGKDLERTHASSLILCGLAHYLSYIRGFLEQARGSSGRAQ